MFSKISISCDLSGVFFVVIFFFIVLVQARDPKGTPLDELLRKQDTVCKTINRTSIDEARLGWSACVDSFILRPNDDIDEFEELRQYYTFFCRDDRRFKGCWRNVTKLLNRCEAGRGDIAEKLYFFIYDLTCRNNGSVTANKIIKSSEHGDLCEMNYLTKTCNETRKDWYSIDICRRYEAQKICEQAAVSSCNNKIHKEMLLQNLQEIGTSLKCVDTTSSSPTAGSRNDAYNSAILLISIMSQFAWAIRKS
ncbi:uncharacterized protein LOC110859919 [Folsomia candida]|uniref:Uncharacterized protein n=1 Tax=Folsomia candida TaxID=158441 RepID=A0A226D9C0_FOLCA|nr:uncharacterized protein LOC110859919 [Folsomia candida]OXA41743.1 hypothetical protein Fcan01_23447 [Folsomia candida]